MAENNDVSSSSAKKQSMVRLDIYLKRHASSCSAEFHESVDNFLGHCESSINEKLHAFVQSTRTTRPLRCCTQAPGIHDDAKILDFDGHAEVVVLKIDVLKKLVEDDFFFELAKPDEEALVDMNSVMQTIGCEEIHVENGRAV